MQLKVRHPNGRFASLKRKIYWFMIMALTFAGLGMALAGYLWGDTVQAAVPEVITVQAKAPIMDRIADCESGNGSTGSATQVKNGQVLISINNNGTYDQGKYQINSIWNKKASELGFNLATEEGNTGFAKWMYANKGTGDWASSQKCWSR